MKKIIAASQNRHKIEEMEKILSKYGMEIIARDDAGIPKDDIDETGKTFEENSYIKAKAIMDYSGEITIADDSGLEVDYLGKAPGIYSARYAGPECDDEKNLDKVLKLLEGVPMEKRTGRFVCVITMLFPDGRSISARGEVEGHIIEERRGTNGFGYDPIFIPLGYDETFGQLPEKLKNSISHRANALEKLESNLNKM